MMKNNPTLHQQHATPVCAPQELLVTGGGDGTLRLWEPLEGRLLHTLELPRPEPTAAEPQGEQQQGQQAQQPDGQQAAAGAEQQQQQGQEEEEEGSSGEEGEGGEGDAAGEGCSPQGAPADAPVPLALAASPDGRHLVAAIDGRDDLCLLRLDWATRQLAEAGWSALPGLHLPTCLSFDASGTLWAAGGPVADDSTAAFLACGRVEEGAAGDAAAAALAAAPLPDWLPQAAVERLEAKAGNEAELLAAAAERRRLASQLLQKRKYSLAQLEGRKRRRRDKLAKAEEAAKAAAAGGDAAAQ